MGLASSVGRARRARLVVALHVSATLLLAGTAGAQTVATSFSELRGLAKPGDNVHVTDAAGRRTKGKISVLSESTLELLVRKETSDARESFVPSARLTENDVRQIVVERRDPPWRGTLIGLAAVGGPWALVCTRGCTYNEYGAENLFRVTALITTGIAAGIGALVDAAIVKRTLVFYRVPTERSPVAEFTPLVSTSGGGVRMTFRF